MSNLSASPRVARWWRLLVVALLVSICWSEASAQRVYLQCVPRREHWQVRLDGMPYRASENETLNTRNYLSLYVDDLRPGRHWIEVSEHGYHRGLSFDIAPTEDITLPPVTAWPNLGAPMSYAPSLAAFLLGMVAAVSGAGAYCRTGRISDGIKRMVLWSCLAAPVFLFGLLAWLR